MGQFLKIFSRIFCFLLMFHILAMNIYKDYYAHLINYSTISKDFDVEEESNPKSKTNQSSNFDDSLDEYLNIPNSFHQNKNALNFVETSQRLKFHFSIGVLPIVHYEIQIPPPRV